MSIETLQPEIPAQRANVESSRRQAVRSIGQIAWMHDYLIDAIRRGDVNAAHELRQMLETASQ